MSDARHDTVKLINKAFLKLNIMEFAPPQFHNAWQGFPHNLQ